MYDDVPAASQMATRSASSVARRNTWAVMVTSGIETSGNGLGWMMVMRVLARSALVVIEWNLIGSGWRASRTAEISIDVGGVGVGVGVGAIRRGAHGRTRLLR